MYGKRITAMTHAKFYTSSHAVCKRNTDNYSTWEPALGATEERPPKGGCPPGICNNLVTILFVVLLDVQYCNTTIVLFLVTIVS